MSTAGSDPPIFLVAGIALGIYGFVKGFKTRAKKRLIANIPTSKVRSIAVGLVEISGKAKPNRYLLESPFTRKPCVFFQYAILEFQVDEQGRADWVTIAEKTTSNWFYLEDETGKVLINPMAAQLYLNGHEKSFSMRLGSSEEESRFKEGLERLGIDWRGTLGSERRLRCRETILEPGKQIYAIGSARTIQSDSASDIGSENLYVGYDSNVPYFCISDKSENNLLWTFSAQMYALLYGGPALTIMCLFFLIRMYFW